MEMITNFFNAWPTTMEIMAWLDPRIVWLSAAIGLLAYFAKRTPWVWDDVILGGFQALMDRLQRGDKERVP